MMKEALVSKSTDLKLFLLDMILAQGGVIIPYLHNTFQKLFSQEPHHRVFPLQVFKLDGKLLEFRMKL